MNSMVLQSLHQLDTVYANYRNLMLLFLLLILIISKSCIEKDMNTSTGVINMTLVSKQLLSQQKITVFEI